MFFIHCPYCQESRAEPEFSYAGEAFITRPTEPEQLDDVAWADYLFHRTNSKGQFFEQWQHSQGCNKFFIVERNTATNVILASYSMEEAKKMSKEREKSKANSIANKARKLPKKATAKKKKT